MTFLAVVAVLLLAAILITLLAGWRMVGGCLVAVLVIGLWLWCGTWLGSFFGSDWAGFAIIFAPFLIILVHAFVLIAQGKMDWDGTMK